MNVKRHCRAAEPYGFRHALDQVRLRNRCAAELGNALKI
jgi:hypothetical protein